MKTQHVLMVLKTLYALKKTTAPELSKKLGVTVRTVYRYLDELSIAGIPLVYDVGYNGGVRLVDFRRGGNA